MGEWRHGNKWGETYATKEKFGEMLVTEGSAAYSHVARGTLEDQLSMVTVTTPSPVSSDRPDRHVTSSRVLLHIT